MKFDVLRSIAHNLSDSLASGVCLLIDLYDVDVFEEAVNTAEGFIEVDFLQGRIINGKASEKLARAVRLYAEALNELCQKHGTTPYAFEQLITRYTSNQLDKRFVVTIKDRMGKSSSDEYIGMPGERVKTLDATGRIRKKPTIKSKD